MADDTLSQRLATVYVKRAALLGALWCLVPTVIAWTVMLSAFIPFRPIYFVRFVVTAIAGGALGAFANRLGVSLWLTRHRSPEGPATVLEGAAIGAAVGWITGLVGPLASFIGTEHVEDAKTIVIVGWLAAAGMGALAGALLASLWLRAFGSERAAPRP
jgi:hypothetical protein